ncbi:uncharacterized protein LOC135322098 [Camelus dromedarius]|uniref:uncharacterized protein LOC135322098 n=1 Tax=Camelus dromedarius TaxID=9838 RepID=UPI0031197D9D
MGLIFTKPWSLFCNQEHKVIIVGLDNAGKTTILYQFLMNKVVHTSPTTGSNVEETVVKNTHFLTWDIGGQESLRSSWNTYYTNTEFIIPVVNSIDGEQLAITKEELYRMLAHKSTGSSHLRESSHFQHNLFKIFLLTHSCSSAHWVKSRLFLPGLSLPERRASLLRRSPTPRKSFTFLYGRGVPRGRWPRWLPVRSGMNVRGHLTSLLALLETKLNCRVRELLCWSQEVWASEMLKAAVTSVFRDSGTLASPCSKWPNRLTKAESSAARHRRNHGRPQQAADKRARPSYLPLTLRNPESRSLGGCQAAAASLQVATESAHGHSGWEERRACTVVRRRGATTHFRLFLENVMTYPSVTASQV